MAQRLIPGFVFVDETGSSQRLIPGVGFAAPDNVESAPATINLVASGTTIAYSTSSGVAGVSGIPPATINLVGSSTSFGMTSGTGVAGVTGSAVINLVASSTTIGITSGTGIAVINASGTGLILSDEFYTWNNQLLTSQLVENVVILGMDRSLILSLSNQTTNAQGRLSITNAAIVPGTNYMLASFSTDGLARGFKRHTAT